MDSDLREEIHSILKASGEMTVATVRPDGYPQATDMLPENWTAASWKILV